MAQNSNFDLTGSLNTSINVKISRTPPSGAPLLSSHAT